MLDAALLAVAWVTEWTIFGPFDAIYVAFTIAGAFVWLAALPTRANLDGRTRKGLAVAAMALVGAALALRFLSGLGNA